MTADLEKRVRRWHREVRACVVSGRPSAEVLAAHDELDSALAQVLDDAFPSYRCSEADWCRALREQAAEDLSAAILLNQNGGPPAAWAMLLQMAFEKFAKASMARTDAGQFRRWRLSHAAASRFVKTLALQHKLLGVTPKEATAAANAVKALERAHPALARHGPHLEYPWEADGEVRRPGTHLQVVRELSDPKSAGNAALVFRFASALDENFDSIFG